MVDARENSNRRPLDPDPITTGSFVFAAIAATAGVGTLLHRLRTARELSRSRQRKLLSIADSAARIAKSLTEDLDKFESIWRFGVVQADGNRYLVWDLGTYDYHALNKLLSRCTAAHKALTDLQNKIGDLELPEIGDAWRFHSIDVSTRLFSILASIQSGEDVVEAFDELRKRLKEYVRSVDELNEALGHIRERLRRR